MSTPVPPELVGRPFRLDEARRAGLTVGVLRGARFAHLTRAVYVVGSGRPALAQQAQGVALAVPDAVVSCSSAAAMWGVPVPVDGLDRLHVCGAGQVHRRGVVAHDRAGGDAIHGSIHGVRVTSPERTFVDLAAESTDADLLAVGDALVSRSLVTPAALISASAAATGRRGAVRARRIAALVRIGVDSPMESMLRLLILADGLPEPVVGRDVVWQGRWLARPDLSYPAERVAIEYDGLHHERSARQRQRDICRNEDLIDAGWVVRTVTARDVLGRLDVSSTACASCSTPRRDEAAETALVAGAAEGSRAETAVSSVKEDSSSSVRGDSSASVEARRRAVGLVGKGGLGGVGGARR